jgi:hypothetical protein
MVLFLLSACHGGKEEDEEHLEPVVLQRCSGELLELRLPWAVPKRRPQLAAAIFGQEADPASLGSQACQSVFFLCERNTFSLAMSIKPLPSQVILSPAWVEAVVVGGCSSPAECLDPIAFSAIFLRVKTGFVKDLIIISFYSGVLFVKLFPLP